MEGLSSSLDPDGRDQESDDGGSSTADSGSGYRSEETRLGMPGVMGRSHFGTQDDIYRAEEPERKTAFQRVRDYLKIKWLLWVYHYVKSRFGSNHRFKDYDDRPGDNGIYPLSAGDGQPIRIVLAGDWASGTSDSDSVGRLIKARSPHITIHLGDIYYVGARREVEANMLGGIVRWPLGTRGSFSLNSNHEMYARGIGYYKYLLPKLGMRDSPDAELGQQWASFFCLRSEHWLVIGLDTGYHSVGIPFIEKLIKPSCKLHDKLIAWLRDEVKVQDDRARGIVLLSHHQYYSEFEDRHERAARQLSTLVNRPVLWFWGHEHRLALYGRHATKKGKLEAYGRCVGHGGLPVEDIREAPKTDARHRVGLVYYDRRERKRIGDKKTPVGFNGFAELEFQERSLRIEYRDIDDRALVEEKWRVGDGGHLEGVSIRQVTVDEDLVTYSDKLDDAIST